MNPIKNSRPCSACWSRAILGMILLAATTASGFEPTLQNPSVDVPPEWRTPVEASDFRKTATYDETIAFCKRLESASDYISYQTFGLSGGLRELPLVVASKERVFFASQRQDLNKPVVFIQNCIHAGESAGKDACLMLLRDIAVTKTREELLDHAVLIIVPIFNVDGHERFSAYARINQNGPDEMGWRVTARNLNLNRDYMKADAIEMRALLEQWNAWRPDLHIDTHTTDGGDWQYDVAYSYGSLTMAAAPIAAWLQDEWEPYVTSQLKKDGHLPITYFGLRDSRDPKQGIRSGGFAPRFSTGYFTIRNRPSILVETHMLKSYRTRVIGQYNLIRHSVDLLEEKGDALREAAATADYEVATALNSDQSVMWPLTVKSTDETSTIEFKGVGYTNQKSEISGDAMISYETGKPETFEVPWQHQTEVDQRVRVPLGYLVPAEWTEVIELVRAHGLKAFRLEEPVTADVETYRLTNPEFAKRPWEGRFRVSCDTEMVRMRRTYGMGSLFVPVGQPDGKVAVHLFEPDAPDSLVKWGFFSGIFEQKEYAEHYVLEKLARKMLAEDPALREAFDKKLAEDGEFAKDPRRRLEFFYERSPYWDQHLGLYPVSRVLAPIDVRLFPI